MARGATTNQLLKDLAAKAKARPIDKGTKETTSEEAPEINLLRMGRDALALQRESYPQQLQLQQEYGPQFAAADVATANARASGEMSGISANGANFGRALRAGSPEIDQATGAITSNLSQLGPSDIEREQQRQALADLRLGGTLSAEESRTANQSARAAFAARGIGRGQTAAIGEVMNREQYANSRRDQRRAYASAVDGQATNRRSTDAAIGNNAMNTLGSFYDPQMRLYGRGGSAVSGQVQGPNAGSPYLQTAGQVATANLNAQDAFQARKQEQYQFGVNREDSYYFSEQNLANGNANAAAARKASTTNAAIGAGGTALGLAALAFLW
jgi:hypothetical protein